MASNDENDPPPSKVSKLAEMFERRVIKQVSKVSELAQMFEKRAKQQNRQAPNNRTKSCYVKSVKRNRMENGMLNKSVGLERKQRQHYRSRSLVKNVKANDVAAAADTGNVEENHVVEENETVVKPSLTSIDHLHYFQTGQWRTSDGKVFSLDELQEKLDLTGSLFIKPLAPSQSISTLLPKVSSCSLIELTLHNQTITFGEFKTLTEAGTIRKVKFLAVIIKDEDGALVTFDKIMKELSLIETITYGVVSTKDNYSVTLETADLLCELPVFENLQSFELFHIPRWFDIASFCNFMKNHSRAQYDLRFVLDSSLNRSKIKSMIQSCTFLDRLPAINFK